MSTWANVVKTAADNATNLARGWHEIWSNWLWL